MAYIDREELIDRLNCIITDYTSHGIYPDGFGIQDAIDMVVDMPEADVVDVVRCQDCVHAVPLDRNCELSTSLYMHCGLWRGDETKNVWHKYKKYYKDYSLVYREDFCSAGEKMDGDGDGE